MKKKNSQLNNLKSKINKTIHLLEKGKFPDSKTLIKLFQEINSISLESVLQSEPSFRTALYSISDAVITTDKNGKIQQMNPVAEKLCGWKETEAINKPLDFIFKIIDEQTGKKIKYSADKILQSGKIVKLPDHSLLITKKGKEIPIANSGAPIKNDKGEIVGIVLVFRDQSKERENQNKLSERERKYSTLISNLPGFVYRCLNDRDWTMEFISDGCKQITGYAPGDFINQKKLNFNDIIVPAYQESIWKKWQKSLKDKNYIELEYPIKSKSGKIKWVWERGRGIYDTGGKLLYLEGYIVDVTESKSVLTEIQKSKDRLQLLVEGTPHLFFYVQNLEGLVEYISPSIENITGYTVEQWLNQKHWFITDSPINQIAKQRTYAHLRGEINTDPVYVEILHANGSKVMIELYERPIIKDGNVIGLQGVANDITENKKVEQLLRESEEKYRTLAENINDALYSITRDGIISYISGAIKQILGYDANEIIGTRFINYVFKDDFNQLPKQIKRIQSGTTDPIEYRLLTKSGKIHWIRSSGKAIYENNKLVGFQGVIIDINNEKLFEEKLKESEERYRIISNLTSDYLFSTAVSKDGKNELVWIAGSFEKITGYKIDEYKKVGGWRARLHPNDLELDDLDIQKLHKKEKVIREIRTYNKNGSLVWVRSHAQPIWDNKTNKLIGINGAVEDITERKKNEETLSMMAKMLDTAPNSITVHDYDGKYVYANSSALKMHAYTEEEYKKLNLQELEVAEDKSLVQERWRMIKEMGGAIFEVQHFRKDKSRIPLEVYAKNVKWAGQSVMLNISTDITERKLAEEMLRESEHRYHSFIDSNVDLMFVKDENFRYIVANEATLKYFNKIREELLFKTDFEVMDEETARNFRISDLKALEAGSVVITEERSHNRIYESTKFPLSLKNNKVGIGGIMHDITIRKRSEIIQIIQNNIAEAVITYKSLTSLFEIIRVELSSIINVNNFFIALYDEKTGMLRSDVDADEIEEIPEWPAENSMTGYVIEKQKSILIKKDEINRMIASGEAGMVGVIPEIWLGVPFKISGKVFGVLVVQSYDDPNAYDQTIVNMLEVIAHELSIYIQHKNAEEETLKLSTAIVQSPISVIITKPDGSIEFVNPKFTEVTGYSLEEVKGNNPRILKSGLHTKEFYSNLWETILSGKVWQGEFRNKKKNGEHFWGNAIISPIINSEGVTTNYVAVQEDISDKKKMIEELIIAKENAEEMNRVKSSFFANMSHELRTPMVGILGFSEVLMSELKDNTDYFYMINSVHKSGERLLETLNLILSLSKLEASKIEVNLKSQNIIPLLKESFNFFESVATTKGLSYIFDSEKDEVLCEVDQLLFVSVFNNLINNAIKFTDAGRVTLSVNLDSEYAVISVADTGIGISEEKQHVIWDEFRQASEGLNRSFEGTGLGLTIAKRYTNLMKGNVSVKSTLHKGTTFMISFPLSPEFSKSKEHSVIDINSELKTSTENSPANKVLYIEDDEIAIRYVKTITKGIYLVDSANNSDDALTMVKQNKYDVILMDINLHRGMDGIELTAILRNMENYKSIPIIALTAFATGKEKVEFLSKGMTHYLSKPFTRHQLLDIINDALSGK